jgi:hypothetical protein
MHVRRGAGWFSLFPLVRSTEGGGNLAVPTWAVYSRRTAVTLLPTGYGETVSRAVDRPVPAPVRR